MDELYLYKLQSDMHLLPLSEKIITQGPYDTKYHMEIVKAILNEEGISMEEALFSFLTAISTGDIRVSRKDDDTFFKDYPQDKIQAFVDGEVRTIGLYSKLNERLNRNFLTANYYLEGRNQYEMREILNNIAYNRNKKITRIDY